MPDDTTREERMTVLFRGDQCDLFDDLRDHLTRRYPEDWWRRQAEWLREAVEEKLAREEGAK